MGVIDLLLRDSSDKLVVHKSGKKKTTTKLFKKMTLNSFAEREKEMKEKKHALPDATSLSAWHNAAWHNAAQCGGGGGRRRRGGEPAAGRWWRRSSGRKGLDRKPVGVFAPSQKQREDSDVQRIRIPPHTMMVGAPRPKRHLRHHNAHPERLRRSEVHASGTHRRAFGAPSGLASEGGSR